MAGKSFCCIRQINNWLRNSMLTNLLGDLAVLLHGHTILIFKLETYSAYMSIHPHRMMASSLFIGS